MGCFISREDDQYKVNMKTAMLVSRFEPEDNKARQEIDEKNIARALELSLMENRKDQQIPKTSKKPSKKKGSKKHSDDDEKEAVNLPPQPAPAPATVPVPAPAPAPAPPPPPPLPPPPSPPTASISDGGKSVMEGGGLCCQICHGPFAKNEIAEKGKYHKHCYKEHRNPYCYVCKGKFPLNEEGKRKYHEHPFWKQKYCPSHDNDETPKCCSCERLEPHGMNYVSFEDDRRLCLECMESSVMDSCESQHLQKEIRGFFDGLYMKINEKEFPIHLVNKQTLIEAVREEKIDNHTRGVCLSKEKIVPSITEGPKMGPDKKLTDIVTERQWVKRCILIIYGLPRLLTGYILAHEMMHAWLRLNGYRDLKLELEEGLCQMLALRWLESQTYAFPDTAAASASSHTTPAASTLKKGDPLSDFEKKLIKFCIFQIQEDDSVVYGKGFRQINDMMLQNDDYAIKNTVQEIVRASKAKAIPDAKL